MESISLDAVSSSTIKLPWWKSYCMNYQTQFYNSNDSTDVLDNLLKCIDNEVQNLPLEDIERCKTLFAMIRKIIMNIWWRMLWRNKRDWRSHWKKSFNDPAISLEKSECDCLSKLMSNYIRIGILLTAGDPLNPHLEPVLILLKMFSSSDVVYDATLSVGTLPKKYRKTYVFILKHILFSGIAEKVTEPVTYLKIIFLFRKLKTFTKDELALAGLKKALSYIQPPPNIILWLQSMDFVDVGLLKLKKLGLQLLKSSYKSWMRTVFRKLYKSYHADNQNPISNVSTAEINASSISTLLDNCEDHSKVIKKQDKETSKRIKNKEKSKRKKKKKKLKEDNFENTKDISSKVRISLESLKHFDVSPGKKANDNTINAHDSEKKLSQKKDIDKSKYGEPEDIKATTVRKSDRLKKCLSFDLNSSLSISKIGTNRDISSNDKSVEFNAFSDNNNSKEKRKSKEIEQNYSESPTLLNSSIPNDSEQDCENRIAKNIEKSFVPHGQLDCTLNSFNSTLQIDTSNIRRRDSNSNEINKDKLHNCKKKDESVLSVDHKNILSHGNQNKEMEDLENDELNGKDNDPPESDECFHETQSCLFGTPEPNQLSEFLKTKNLLNSHDVTNVTSPNNSLTEYNGKTQIGPSEGVNETSDDVTSLDSGNGSMSIEVSAQHMSPLKTHGYNTRLHNSDLLPKNVLLTLKGSSLRASPRKRKGLSPKKVPIHLSAEPEKILDVNDSSFPRLGTNDCNVNDSNGSSYLEPPILSPVVFTQEDFSSFEDSPSTQSKRTKGLSQQLLRSDSCNLQKNINFQSNVGIFSMPPELSPVPIAQDNTILYTSNVGNTFVTEVINTNVPLASQELHDNQSIVVVSSVPFLPPFSISQEENVHSDDISNTGSMEATESSVNNAGVQNMPVTNLNHLNLFLPNINTMQGRCFIQDQTENLNLSGSLDTNELFYTILRNEEPNSNSGDHNNLDNSECNEERPSLPPFNTLANSRISQAVAECFSNATASQDKTVFFNEKNVATVENPDSHRKQFEVSKEQSIINTNFISNANDSSRKFVVDCQIVNNDDQGVNNPVESKDISSIKVIITLGGRNNGSNSRTKNNFFTSTIDSSTPIRSEDIFRKALKSTNKSAHSVNPVKVPQCKRNIFSTQTSCDPSSFRSADYTNTTSDKRAFRQSSNENISDSAAHEQSMGSFLQDLSKNNYFASIPYKSTLFSTMHTSSFQTQLSNDVSSHRTSSQQMELHSNDLGEKTSSSKKSTAPNSSIPYRLPAREIYSDANSDSNHDATSDNDSDHPSLYETEDFLSSSATESASSPVKPFRRRTVTEDSTESLAEVELSQSFSKPSQTEIAVQSAKRARCVFSFSENDNGNEHLQTNCKKRKVRRKTVASARRKPRKQIASKVQNSAAINTVFNIRNYNQDNTTTLPHTQDDVSDVPPLPCNQNDVPDSTSEVLAPCSPNHSPCQHAKPVTPSKYNLRTRTSLQGKNCVLCKIFQCQSSP